MGTTCWYTTVEDVAGALDVQPTARQYRDIARQVEAGSRAVDQLCRRPDGAFAPWTGTRYFDWPDDQSTSPWRLWLAPHTLVSLAGLTVDNGATSIATTDVVLYPNSGPPYTRLEVDLGSTSALSSDSTTQQALAVTGGPWGWTYDTDPAGALAEALDDSETGVDVTDASGIGIGSVVIVGTERMIVTGRGWLDTGANIDVADSLTAAAADVAITLSTTVGAPVAGETILVGAERMRVVDVAGTTCSVKRAVDGTVLAAHAGGSDIYAPRTLTVERGALGTAAAAHNLAAAVSVWVPPALVAELAAAEAINLLLQRSSGFARTVGSGDNQREAAGRGLAALRKQVWAAYGLKMRVGAV